jgi:transposase InsO family protein
MCKFLNISRSSYYFEVNKKGKQTDDSSIVASVISAFNASRQNYGARKIKAELARGGKIISRRKIRKIMKQNNLISKYQIKQYKPHKSPKNNDNIGNKLNREFDNKAPCEAVVSDLTYVKVAGQWFYICVLIDLFNREIVGHSAGQNKDAKLVRQAFMKASIPLNKIKLFHTDRGTEFKNEIIDELLISLNIERSLSEPGCPYDNAVAEATYKAFKVEFCDREFESLEELVCLE